MVRVRIPRGMPNNKLTIGNGSGLSSFVGQHLAYHKYAMQIHRIHDLSNEYVVKILEEGLSDLPIGHLYDNYSPNQCDLNCNLFYILQEGRYKDGSYFIVEKDGKYVCSSGWNRYNDSTALVLSRSYVDPAYRTQYLMAELLLPTMIEETSGYQHTWLTCNKNNPILYEWFVRAEQGKRTAMFAEWPEIYKKFKPIGEMNIYYTQQMVAQLER